MNIIVEVLLLLNWQGNRFYFVDRDQKLLVNFVIEGVSNKISLMCAEVTTAIKLNKFLNDCFCSTVCLTLCEISHMKCRRVRSRSKFGNRNDRPKYWVSGRCSSSVSDVPNRSEIAFGVAYRVSSRTHFTAPGRIYISRVSSVFAAVTEYTWMELKGGNWVLFYSQVLVFFHNTLPIGHKLL